MLLGSGWLGPMKAQLSYDRVGSLFPDKGIKLGCSTSSLKKCWFLESYAALAEHTRTCSRPATPTCHLRVSFLVSAVP